MRRLSTAAIGGAVTLAAPLLFAGPALADVGGPPVEAVTIAVLVVVGVVVAGVVALSAFVLRNISRSRREARVPCRTCGGDVGENAPYCSACGAAQAPDETPGGEST